MDALDIANVAVKALEKLHSVLGDTINNAPLLTLATEVKLTQVSYTQWRSEMKTRIEDARLFVICCTAWDCMLGETCTKAHRTADHANIKNATKSVPSFPGALLDLLDRWRDGEDIQSIVP